MIIKYSDNIAYLKKLGAMADEIADYYTKTPIVDMDDLHELVDGLSGEQFEKFYNSLQRV
jgi:hypothetical protein